MKCLGIGIYGYKFDPFQAGADHPVDSIVTSATHSNHLNSGKLVEVEFKIQHLVYPPLFYSRN